MRKGLVTVVISAVVVLALGSAVPVPAAEIQGQVQSVTADSIKLADGTMLSIPQGAHVDRAQLKPGATVKASFEEQKGQKVLTNIVVMPTAAPKY